MSAEFVEERAPAKVNLYLHVGGVRADGLHDLASLFVFADTGDIIRAEKTSGAVSLDIVGPFADALKRFDPSTNLVMRAALALKAAAGVDAGARLTLDKRLPIAAGIGGGSADAAAALRALVRLWNVRLEPAALVRIAFALGADVPACLARAPVFVGGAGERVTTAPALPPLWMCLVNPLVETPTGPIFRAFDAANPAPPAPAFARLEARTASAVEKLMRESVNDLQPYAIAERPVVAETITLLQRRPGCLAARMSGSGASVFGLFTSLTAAKKAACAAAARGWWSAAAPLCR